MKKVLVFNDISGLGNCSAVVNIVVLSKLGHSAIPVITANYSCQTGFDNCLTFANPNVQLHAQSILDNCLPDAVYVGFCKDAQIVNQVTNVVNQLRQDVGFVIVDPVLGDNGKMFSVFDNDYLQAIKKLCRFADVITPNLTEACLLADVDYGEVISHKSEPTFLAVCGKVFADFCKTVGCKRAVITGVHCGQLMGNIVLEDGVHYVTNEHLPIDYSGTGDLFSSVICGEMLNDHNLLQATQVAANFAEKAIGVTSCPDRRFGTDFVCVLDQLKPDLK